MASYKVAADLQNVACSRTVSSDVSRARDLAVTELEFGLTYHASHTPARRWLASARLVG